MPQRVLLVEDSNLFGKAISTSLSKTLGLEVAWAQSYAEAEELLEVENHDFSAALLDLNLPDAPDGEIVDYVLGHKIPAVVFTGDFSDEAQEMLWGKKVVDYVLKEGPQSVQIVTDIVGRILRNRTITILVVDDSPSARKHIGNLLAVHQYKVVEAKDGIEALDMLARVGNIKLVLTDYNMPGMDGYELTKKIRAKYDMDELAIIGLSSEGNHKLAVKFVKHGANDFLSKPFIAEQLYYRIIQNLRLIERFDRIRKVSQTDFLTQLSNRQYFFECAEELVAHTQRRGLPATVAMLDIDHFKKVNDTYGHQAGDVVLKRVSSIIASYFRSSDIVSRFGGEEFCVLAAGMEPRTARRVFGNLRKEIEESVISTDQGDISPTISIGVYQSYTKNLEDLVREADERLYAAKEGGRNRVVMED
jgi:diguanylate cyclase (GGDEF)-like protein